MGLMMTVWKLYLPWSRLYTYLYTHAHSGNTSQVTAGGESECTLNESLILTIKLDCAPAVLWFCPVHLFLCVCAESGRREGKTAL